ncbi:MAG: YebC/PmpR family DNA-binding transcriptional regulator [Candidatus Paceibacterota bacterium]
MSGHNKWSKIKHKKAVTDARRSKIFSKLLRSITTEAKLANGNTNSPNLRSAIERARKENVPNDNIERAVKKGMSPDTGAMEAITYEAYGPGGAGLIIEALTDNKNKAAQEVKFILSSHNSSLGAIGSVAWAFKKEGVEWIPTQTTPISEEDGEKLSRLIDDLEENDEVQNVYTNAE